MKEKPFKYNPDKKIFISNVKKVSVFRKDKLLTDGIVFFRNGELIVPIPANVPGSKRLHKKAIKLITWLDAISYNKSNR